MSFPLSESVIDRLIDVYEGDPSSLVPARTTAPVVLDAARLQVGDASARMKSQDPPRDEVLRGYLGLLYELRGKRPGTEIPLRTYDMDSLADALGADPDAIETRLVELMHVTREEAAAMRAAMIRRRLILPAAGIALGAGVFAGSMKLVDQSGSTGASHQARGGSNVERHAGRHVVRVPDARGDHRADERWCGDARRR